MVFPTMETSSTRGLFAQKNGTAPKARTYHWAAPLPSPLFCLPPAARARPGAAQMRTSLLPRLGVTASRRLNGAVYLQFSHPVQDWVCEVLSKIELTKIAEVSFLRLYFGCVLVSNTV